MLVADQALLRLADPAERQSLLPASALLEIALASYEFDAALVVGNATAVFESVDLAVSINPTVGATVRWSRPGTAAADEGTVTVSGLVPPTIGADAVWLGAISLRLESGAGTITAVSATDVGRLPDGVDQLELALSFSAPEAVTAATQPTVLPVVVAFIVADSGAAPGELLRRTEAARRAAERYPLRRTPAGAPVRLRETCVCWIIPATLFDDDGWPGATGASAAQKRNQRLAAARSWLRSQGIAVVTT